jgi:hypothetical protein
LNEEQQRAFIIKDNVGFGEWDWDALADEWDYKDLKEWGLDIPGVSLDDDFNVSDEYNYQNKVTVQFKTLEEATSYHEKCIQENLKAQLS